MKSEHKAYLALIFAMLCWATSGIAIKQALVVFSPLTLVVFRFTLSVMLMFLLGKVAVFFAKPTNQLAGEPLQDLVGNNLAGETPASHTTQNTSHTSQNPSHTPQPDSQLALNPLAKRDIPLFLFAGFLQPFLYYLAETYAYQLLSSPTIAEALLSTSPLLSPIFAFLAIRERISRQTLLGIFISTIGMLLITVQFSDSFSLGNPWGVLLAFLAVTMAIFYTIYLKKIPEHYNSLSIVFYVQLFSLCFFYPAWLVQGGIDQLHHLITADPQALRTATAMVVYLAVFSSIIAFILFCYAVRIVGVSKANAFNNVRPVFTALIMLIFFGELLPAVKWIGILLVVIGLFYSSKKSPQ